MRARFLSQAFQEAGYKTAITGKWHLGHGHKKFLPRARGFDHAYGHRNGDIDYFTHEREGGLEWNRDGITVREEGYSTFLLGAEAVRFIRQRDRGRHTYAAMVDAMDATIGRVLAALDQERIARDTLALFFSDNGGPVANAATNTPLRAGKATTFEGGIRVPAIAASRVERREDLLFVVESGDGVRLAVHHGEWKLVREEPAAGPPREYLFRPEEDPGETTGLASKNPGLVRDLAARISEWRKLHPPDGVRPTPRPPRQWMAPAQ